MRIVEEKIYKFDELSDEVKEKVIDRFRESNDFPFLADELKEQLEELLKENKIEIHNEDKFHLYYSLSYSQGDGVCFIGIFEWDKYIVTITHNFMYYHYRSVDISFEYREEYRFNEDGNEQLVEGEEYDKCEKEFKDIYKEICLKLEKTGYSEIEYENSEEAIKETIEANDYEFYDNGDIY